MSKHPVELGLEEQEMEERSQGSNMTSIQENSESMMRQGLSLRLLLFLGS